MTTESVTFGTKVLDFCKKSCAKTKEVLAKGYDDVSIFAKEVSGDSKKVLDTMSPNMKTGAGIFAGGSLLGLGSGIVSCIAKNPTVSKIFGIAGKSFGLIGLAGLALFGIFAAKANAANKVTVDEVQDELSIANDTIKEKERDMAEAVERSEKQDKEWRSALSAAEGDIVHLKEENERQSKEIDEQKKAIEEKNNDIAALGISKANLTREKTEQKRKIEEQNKEIEQQKKTISDLDTEIKKQNEKIKQKDDEIKKQKDEQLKKDREYNDLYFKSEELKAENDANKERLIRQNSGNISKANHIGYLNDRVAKQAKELDKLNSEIKGKDAKVAELNAALDEAKKKLEEAKKSASFDLDKYIEDHIVEQDVGCEPFNLEEHVKELINIAK